jgi:hypothetical protein
MTISSFDLFKDQQKRFIEALIDYDPKIWFPPLRGGHKENQPGNWFICFVPPSWGRWRGKIYGVHFAFIYGQRPERMRLVVGVEEPMKKERRKPFKEEVISMVRAKGISFPGFVLRANERGKLLNDEKKGGHHTPFNEQSWQIALKQYIGLQPLVEVIATAVRDYYDNGAFDVAMEFPG